VYFDNDVKVRAPFDAMALAQRLHHATPATVPQMSVAEEPRASWPAVRSTRKTVKRIPPRQKARRVR